MYQIEQMAALLDAPNTQAQGTQISMDQGLHESDEVTALFQSIGGPAHALNTQAHEGA
jgi:hypothetical protein